METPLPMFSTHPISCITYLAAYALSLFLSVVICFATIRLLKGESGLARFVRSRVHTGRREVVSFGGVAVIVSFTLTLWLVPLFFGMHPDHRSLFGAITLGTVLMFLLGIYDDLVVARPWTKLTGQLIIAIGLYQFGFHIDRIGDWGELGALSPVVTILWFVGISNSLNLIDGKDGLAGGLIFLSCLTLTLVYLERDIFEAPFLSVILAGSVFGFLLFNYPPAKIILGDTGSLPLGLLISLVTLLPLAEGFTDEIYYLLPLVTLLVPITDTLWAFFRRVRKGVSPFSRDAEHFHHRLERLGLSPTRTIFVLLGIALYFDVWSLVPVFNINLIPKFTPVFFVFILIHLAFLVSWLRKKEKEIKT